MGVPDEIVDRFRRAFLDHEMFGDALLHQTARSGRADHVDLVFHRRGDGRLEDRRAQFLTVARVRVRHHDDQFVRHDMPPYRWPTGCADRVLKLPTDSNF